MVLQEQLVILVWLEAKGLLEKRDPLVSKVIRESKVIQVNKAIREIKDSWVLLATLVNKD